MAHEIEKEVVYVSPSSAYRYMKKNGLMIPQEASKREPEGDEWKEKPTKPNEFWHTDITYIWIPGYGFYYFNGANLNELHHQIKG